MKLLKRKLVALVVFTISLFTYLPATHAEVRLGLDYANFDGDIDQDSNTVLLPADSGSASGIGLFGQWRTASTNPVSFGVHLGFPGSNGKYENSESSRVTGEQAIEILDFFDLILIMDDGVTPVRFNANENADVGNIRLSNSIEQDGGMDLLAVVAWNRQGTTPFLMFGYSTVDVNVTGRLSGSGFDEGDATLLNGSVSEKGDGTLDGWKLVAGIEGGKVPWVWHAALEYADYGGDDIRLRAVLADGTRSGEAKIGGLDGLGFRFGVSYRF